MKKLYLLFDRKTNKNIGRSIILIEAYIPNVVSIYEECNFNVLQKIGEKS